MKSYIKYFFIYAFFITVIISCAQIDDKAERNNPYDPDGENFVYPFEFVKKIDNVLNETLPFNNPRRVACYENGFFVIEYDGVDTKLMNVSYDGNIIQSTNINYSIYDIDYNYNIYLVSDAGKAVKAQLNISRTKWISGFSEINIPSYNYNTDSALAIVSDNGKIFILYDNTVHMHDSNGNKIKSFGHNYFGNTFDISADGDHYIYVLDNKKNGIHVFNPSGSYKEFREHCVDDNIDTTFSIARNSCAFIAIKSDDEESSFYVMDDGGVNWYACDEQGDFYQGDISISELNNGWQNKVVLIEENSNKPVIKIYKLSDEYNDLDD